MKGRSIGPVDGFGGVGRVSLDREALFEIYLAGDRLAEPRTSGESLMTSDGASSFGADVVGSGAWCAVTPGSFLEPNGEGRLPEPEGPL